MNIGIFQHLKIYSCTTNTLVVHVNIDFSNIFFKEFSKNDFEQNTNIGYVFNIKITLIHIKKITFTRLFFKRKGHI